MSERMAKNNNNFPHSTSHSPSSASLPHCSHSLAVTTITSLHKVYEKKKKEFIFHVLPSPFALCFFLALFLPATRVLFVSYHHHHYRRKIQHIPFALHQLEIFKLIRVLLPYTRVLLSCLLTSLSSSSSLCLFFQSKCMHTSLKRADEFNFNSMPATATTRTCIRLYLRIQGGKITWKTS